MISFNQIHEEVTRIVNALKTSGGGGGSIVEWKQLTADGTHIATISIDGVPTEVYAPNSGGGSGSVVSVEQKIDFGDNVANILIDGNTYNIYNGHKYNETEKVVGKWIDGRNVYEQVINMENVTYAQEIVIKENVDIIIEENLYYSDDGLHSGSKFPCKGFPQINYWFYNHLLYLRSDNKIIFRLDGKNGNINIRGVVKYVKVNE